MFQIVLGWSHEGKKQKKKKKKKKKECDCSSPTTKIL